MNLTLEAIGWGAILSILAHTAMLGYFGGSIRQILKDYGRRIDNLEGVVKMRRSDDRP